MPPLSPAEAAALVFRLLCGSDADTAGESDFDQGSWPSIVAASQRHGLAPLLFWRLTHRPLPSTPPPPARAALRAAYLGALGANLHIREQLRATLAALAGDGIAAILLKGAHLAFGVYRDPGVRPMCDIDLLVKREDVSAAATTLTALGYTPARPYHLESELARSHHLPPFVKPGCHFIEVHWTLLRPEEPYPIDTMGLWSRSRPSGIPDLPARILDPADLLLHLCLHGIAADRFSGGLRRLFDVIEVARAFKSDPALLETPARASSWGATRSLSLALSLCDDLAPGTLPPDLRQTLVPESAADEPLGLARTLVLNATGSPGRISANLARAIEAPPTAALRGILRGFFPPRAFLATFYGVDPRSAAIWPCYPRRWAYLLRTYAAPAIRAIRGERSAREQTVRQKQENVLADWLAGSD
jgi:hypothetical protein